MSKKIFINNLNSFVPQAVFNELRNDITEDGEKNDDANVIFGTYIDRDSSDKPDGITKMLKVTTPSMIFEFSKTVSYIEVQTQTYHEVPQ